MKGRGTRVLTPTDLQAVTGADARAKTHFVIVDAVGVCESDKTDSRPLDRQPTALPQLLLGVALGKRDEDTLTTLAARLARLDRALTPERASRMSAADGRADTVRTVGRSAPRGRSGCDSGHSGAPRSTSRRSGGRVVTRADIGTDRRGEQRAGRRGLRPVRQSGCSRDALSEVKQETEQTIDTDTLDTVVGQGFDAAAKEKATGLLQSFRDYIEANQAEINALQILYSRPYKQRLTEPMLKELEKKLRDNHAAWTEDRLWDAFAATAGKGERPLAGRTLRRSRRPRPLRAGTATRARALRGFRVGAVQRMAHGQGQGRHDLHAGATRVAQPHSRPHRHQPEHRAGRFRAMRRSTSAGGLGKAHQLFGAQLPKLLDELNEVLAA